MISLIVNADNLGSGSNRDRGILEAYRHGIVTSASLLANGSSFNSATQQVWESGLPVGVHLNLAEGAAITGAIPGLTTPEGHFLGKGTLRTCLASGTCNWDDLHREIAAQIEQIYAAGVRPDHLDSYQHCQLFPCVGDLLSDLAQEYGISGLRNPNPVELECEGPSGPLAAELALYRELNKGLEQPVHVGVKFFRPDGLWGMPLLDRLDITSLFALLARLLDGVWELMVHPGYPGPGDPFNGPLRQVETTALTSPQVQAIVTRRGIRLSHYGGFRCAS